MLLRPGMDGHWMVGFLKKNKNCITQTACATCNTCAQWENPCVTHSTTQHTHSTLLQLSLSHSPQPQVASGLSTVGLLFLPQRRKTIKWMREWIGNHKASKGGVKPVPRRERKNDAQGKTMRSPVKPQLWNELPARAIILSLPLANCTIPSMRRDFIWMFEIFDNCSNSPSLTLDLASMFIFFPHLPLYHLPSTYSLTYAHTTLPSSCSHVRLNRNELETIEIESERKMRIREWVSDKAEKSQWERDRKWMWRSLPHSHFASLSSRLFHSIFFFP